MSKPFRLLFVGNSYTTRNDMPSLIAELAAAAGVESTMETAVMAFGGASLAAHWNRGLVQHMLVETKWDAVVLQDQSTRPLRAPKSMQMHVPLFVDAIRQAGAQAWLYATWARENAPDTQADITTAYAELAAQTGASLVPVGTTWQCIREQLPQFDLYETDMSHPSWMGSYVSACAFVVALFGKRPKPLPGAMDRLGEAELVAMHDIVWNTAHHHDAAAFAGETR